jgi:hypothetical protein
MTLSHGSFLLSEALLTLMICRSHLGTVSMPVPQLMKCIVSLWKKSGFRLGVSQLTSVLVTWDKLARLLSPL